MSKKVLALIVGSLLLNALLIGVMIGKEYRHFHKRRFGGPPPFESVQELASGLPEEKARFVASALKKARYANREVHKKIKSIRQKTLNILTAPDFDETAYRKNVERLHELRGKMMRELADATMELAKTLNVQERAVLADHLKRRPFALGGRGKRRQRPGP